MAKMLGKWCKNAEKPLAFWLETARNGFVWKRWEMPWKEMRIQWLKRSVFIGIWYHIPILRLSQSGEIVGSSQRPHEMNGGDYWWGINVEIVRFQAPMRSTHMWHDPMMWVCLKRGFNRSSYGNFERDNWDNSMINQGIWGYPIFRQSHVMQHWFVQSGGVQRSQVHACKYQPRTRGLEPKLDLHEIMRSSYGPQASWWFQIWSQAWKWDDYPKWVATKHQPVT